MAGDIEKQEIETLTSGGTIQKIINETVTYNEIKSSVDNMWNFLFFSGYLTPVSAALIETFIQYTLKIPNQEVLYAYKTTISQWFKDKLESKDFSVLRKALFDGEADTVEDEICGFLVNTISYNDYKEDFYHGLMTGILSDITGYKIFSNRESGLGRPDLMIVPESIRKTAIIIEFKYIKSKKIKDMEQKCLEALAQIQEQKYTEGLIEQGYQKIMCYGITFAGKRCRVMKGNTLFSDIRH